MFRKVLGFAVLAWWRGSFSSWRSGCSGGAPPGVDILMLALVGLVIYWVIQAHLAGTARRVKDMISGERPAGSDF